MQGREGGPQDSAAIRDFAQGVDERRRKGAKLERKEKRDWVGRGSAKRDSHCWNLRKTWMNANARAQNSEREKMFMGG